MGVSTPRNSSRWWAPTPPTCSPTPPCQRSGRPTAVTSSRFSSRGRSSVRSSASLASPAPPLPVTPVSVADAVSPRVALDAEMVGVGEGGKRSALARIVIVGFDERICYSAFVRPPETVTDWRTAVSGVRPEHMAHALPLRRVQAEVAALLRDRTIIGHGLHNDLKALMLEHPRLNIRDTATYPAYRKQLVQGTRPRRLQALALEFLGWHIPVSYTHLTLPTKA